MAAPSRAPSLANFSFIILPPLFQYCIYFTCYNKPLKALEQLVHGLMHLGHLVNKPINSQPCAIKSKINMYSGA